MSRRRECNTEIEIDMTPMIDMTFLLIIFFIIVNDMSQKDLEELKLPIAMEAGHDEPPERRQVLNVRWFPAGGVSQKVKSQYLEMGISIPDDMEWSDVVWKGQILYYPNIDTGGRTDPIRKGRPDYYWLLAQTMELEWIPYFEKKMDDTLKVMLPDDPVLLRADRNTPFKYLQKIMEVCTREKIMIWKVQFAASEDPKVVQAREDAKN
ncbi:MAG: biopolymer transporter ExbD [Planctomycetota bacterium]|nr:biopolymer transporter ExbD [Planctomycetota bacterium]MDA1114424.1 biopolymer transporter ExbD [Planctomycetota bacterium]